MSAKYYVTKSDLKLVDGKLDYTETILTKPSDKIAAINGKRRFSALGVENVHVIKYVKKRYNKLMREQNKRHKAAKLTAADIAKMAKQADEELNKGDE
jgi:DnaJ-domain-containing protein 1|tara:strand:+ start:130 stop:423 length:294 start_codon:yes stop_codon:yes gene_type:complete